MVSGASDAGGDATTMLGGGCRACAAQGQCLVGEGTALLPQLDACTHHAAATRLLQHALPHLPHLAATTKAAASCAPPSPAPPQLTRAFERG